MKEKDILKKGKVYCGVIEVRDESVLLTHPTDAKKLVDFELPRRWYLIEAVEKAGWKVL